jgi:hypothetical protein
VTAADVNEGGDAGKVVVGQHVVDLLGGEVGHPVVEDLTHQHHQRQPVRDSLGQRHDTTRELTHLLVVRMLFEVGPH